MSDPKITPEDIYQAVEQARNAPLMPSLYDGMSDAERAHGERLARMMGVLSEEDQVR